MAKKIRRKWRWTDLQNFRIRQVRDVLRQLKDYWPVTIRQIHYQLFARQFEWNPKHLGARRNKPNYENSRASQGDLVAVAKWGRIDGRIGWDTIEDNTRTMYRPYKFDDLQSYLKNELHYLLSDYQRCLVQDQDYYIEVWIEKEALFKIFQRVCRKYCVAVVACKGYDSVTYLNKYAEMARIALDQGKKPLVLYFGDLDPSGVDMFEASKYTLEEEMGLKPCGLTRVAVEPYQVKLFKLPNDPESGKYLDSRYKEYIKEYGRVFAELDAFSPRQLEQLAEASIERFMDMEEFKEQQEVAKGDEIRLDRLRQRIVDVINEEFGTYFTVD